MSPVAVTTKPQPKDSRAKPAARVGAVYMPSTETDLRARLNTLQAALSQAEEHIAGVLTMLHDGSHDMLMIEHIGQVLLANAMRPMMGACPTRDDADRTHSDLFLVKAALKGAMAMMAHDDVNPVLNDAFELLDWSQDECGSPALIDLLPEADLAAEFARGRDHAIKMLEEAEVLKDEREGLRCYRKGGGQDNFFRGYFADVDEDRSLYPGFSSVMSAVLRNDNMDLSELARITLAETQAGAPGADGTGAVVDQAARPTLAALTNDKPDAELLTNEAVGLNGLMSWIMSARDTLEAIRLSAQISPALNAELRRFNVSYNSPEWLDQGAGEGMAYLLMYQRSVIEDLGRGAS